MRLSRWIAVTAALVLPFGAALAQRAPDAAAYADLAKLPEIAGLWEITFGGGPRGAGGEGPSLTPAYAAKLKSHQDAQKRGEIEDSPAANCVPPGMPGVMTQPYPIEILVTPGKVTIIAEAYSQWRQIFTDGRSHPDDPDLTFNGHSIGHWEGDTFVIETAGFHPETAWRGSTEKLRVTERLKRIDDMSLEYSFTVADPDTWAEPWSGVYPLTRMDSLLFEYACTEGNYGMANILAGERKAEREAAARKNATPAK